MKPPRNFRPDPFAYHQELELVITDLSNLGDGVGRVDGWVVLVPFVLPGERVRVRVWRNKRTHSEADLVELLEASPDRVEPRCPLFTTCGGCQYQHLHYPAQLAWKSQQIRQLFLKMTGLDLPVNPCLGRPDQAYGYRSKITPHFRRPPDQPAVPIGFQGAATRSVVDVPHCPIASPAINAALPRQRQLLRSGNPPFRKGGTLLLRDTTAGVVTDMRARVEESVGSRTFAFIAGEFFQNNPHVLPLMVDHALQQAAAPGIRFLVDAYCGVGVFGISGAHRFQEVLGIEVNEQAVLLARENAITNQTPNARFLLGQAETLFQQVTFPPQQTTVLLDPPRRGCHPDFLQQLLDYRPARIVYVSCAPDTQARDVRLLHESHYKVTHVQPVDLFPQTRHVENVMTLEDGGRG